MKHLSSIYTLIKKLSVSTKYLLSAIILSASVLVFTALAADYTPGQTLAPTCDPGDSGCTITTPAVSGANTDITSLLGITSLGIDTAVPSSSLHIVSSTEQFRIGYDSNNYAAFEVESSGEMVIGATGGQITFSDAVSIEGDFMVQNGDEDPVLNIDTTGNRVGLGVFPSGDSPQAAVHASSSVSEVMRLSNSLNDYTSFSISAGGLEILPSGTGIVEIGDLGTADKIGASNDDLFIGDELEVDGQAYFDGTATFNSTNTTTFNQPIEITNPSGIEFNDGTIQTTAANSAHATVYRLATSTGFNTTWSSVSFTGGSVNPKNISHSTSVNSERITADIAGTYLISYSINAHNNDSNPHTTYSKVLKNGSTTLMNSGALNAKVNDYRFHIQQSFTAELAASDYLELQIATDTETTDIVPQQQYLGDDSSSAHISIIRIGD